MLHKRAVIAAFCVYGTLLVVAVVISHSWTIGQGGKLDDFVKLAAVWFTGLTSALAASVTLLVLQAQTGAARRLEELKGDVARSVKLAEMRVSRAGQAADAVSGAMAAFYHQYAALENDQFVDQDASKADKEMALARARLASLPSQVLEEKFVLLWQEGRNLHDHVRLLGADADAKKKKDLWLQHGPYLGALLREAEGQVQSALEQSFKGTA